MRKTKGEATGESTTRKSPATPPPDEGAYDAGVRYLGNRPRSVAEIRRHLRTKCYGDAAIDRAVDQLRAQRYIDDEAFARYWVDQRERFRPKGDRALVSELLGKGVPRETIDVVLGDRDPEAEVKQAREAIRRPIARWQTLGEGERKRKIHQFLMARGFSYDTIEAVLERPEDPESD